jgi:hypothetical protein
LKPLALCLRPVRAVSPDRQRLPRYEIRQIRQIRFHPILGAGPHCRVISSHLELIATCVMLPLGVLAALAAEDN